VVVSSRLVVVSYLPFRVELISHDFHNALKGKNLISVHENPLNISIFYACTHITFLCQEGDNIIYRYQQPFKILFAPHLKQKAAGFIIAMRVSLQLWSQRCKILSDAYTIYKCPHLNAIIIISMAWERLKSERQRGEWVSESPILFFALAPPFSCHTP
jgi:hypothetical protein